MQNMTLHCKIGVQDIAMLACKTNISKTLTIRRMGNSCRVFGLLQLAPRIVSRKVNVIQQKTFTHITSPLTLNWQDDKFYNAEKLCQTWMCIIVRQAYKTLAYQHTTQVFAISTTFSPKTLPFQNWGNRVKYLVYSIQLHEQLVRE